LNVHREVEHEWSGDGEPLVKSRRLWSQPEGSKDTTAGATFQREHCWPGAIGHKYTALQKTILFTPHTPRRGTHLVGLLRLEMTKRSLRLRFRGVHRGRG
jgi:hypothetical protein